MLENFTLKTFAGHLGEMFRVHPGGSEPLEVEMISAEGLSAGREGGPDGRPFSVVFRGPKDVHLSQRIHRMEHEEIGAFDIFLVPIGPDEEGLRYEAVFT